MSKFNHLPGIEVSIADGGLIIPDNANTQSMLIIAPSLEANAPKEPVLVRQSSELVDSGFGGYVKGSMVNPIANAWKAAYEGGCRRVYLMALEGATDKERFAKLQDNLFGLLADFTVDHIVAVGVYADKEVENIVSTDLINAEDQANFPNVPGIITYGHVVKGSQSISLPITISVGSNDTFVVDGKTLTLTAKTYDGTEGNSLEDLAADVQAEMAATAGLENFKATIEDNRLVIVGDKSYSVDAQATLEMEASASKKEEHAEGVIYVANFAKLVGEFAETQTLNHSATIGYIAASAPTDNSLLQVKTKVDELALVNNEYSGYVSVVAGPELGYKLPEKKDLYYTNGLVSYVALVTTLRAESAPTQKPLYGVAGAHYNLSLRQLNTLTGNKFVTFRIKNGQVIVTDAVTTAPDKVVDGEVRKSDYTRLSTLRITQAAAQLVREVADPFIGQPNRMPQYNALNSAVKAGLEAMKNSGAISDYRFSIQSSGSTLTEAVIKLDIVPAFELRKISVNVNLTTSL